MVGTSNDPTCQGSVVGHIDLKPTIACLQARLLAYALEVAVDVGSAGVEAGPKSSSAAHADRAAGAALSAGVSRGVPEAFNTQTAAYIGPNRVSSNRCSSKAGITATGDGGCKRAHRVVCSLCKVIAVTGDCLSTSDMEAACARSYWAGG